MLESVKGLVIRTVNVGEKDKILTLFTDTHGIIGVYASGSRVVKSKLLAAADLFCYADYELSVKGDRYSVREAELIESFYGLRTDIERMALGNYITDVVRTVGTENQADVPFLRLTLNTLYAISAGKYPLDKIKAAFEIRAAAILGFCPDISGCALCGAEAGDMALEVMDGSLLCDACRKEAQNSFDTVLEEREGHRRILCLLTAGAIAAWRHCVSCPQERLLSFRLEGETDQRLLYHSAETYLLNHLDRGFDSLQFYRQMAAK